MRALIAVPTYNEATNLPLVVGRALAAVPDATVLVVDDSSPDGTGEVADRLAADDPRVLVRHRPAKAGLGSAYRAAFAWGLDAGFDALVEMDADLSHHPEDLPRLLGALAGADAVIGSRYVPGGRVEHWPARRVALSRGGNRYVQLATGVPIADATSGFRAYRAAALAAVDPLSARSEGYCFQVELALRLWRAGLRVVEVPITFTERREGASKISRRIVIEAVLRTALWGLKGPRRPSPPPPESIVALGRV